MIIPTLAGAIFVLLLPLNCANIQPQLPGERIKLGQINTGTQAGVQVNPNDQGGAQHRPVDQPVQLEHAPPLVQPPTRVLQPPPVFVPPSKSEPAGPAQIEPAK